MVKDKILEIRPSNTTCETGKYKYTYMIEPDMIRNNLYANVVTTIFMKIFKLLLNSLNYIFVFKEKKNTKS